MKIILILMILSGCAMFNNKKTLPSDARNNMTCIEQFLGEMSVEEAIMVCKFINQGKLSEKTIN